MKIRRKTRLARLRLHRRQRQGVAVPQLDETQHTCRHCGHAFEGRVCPQCGMPGDWTRFTWKRLLYGFLDIWGMGNRPMFRSMGHLLWRPGYMIRDYLDGHYLSYFPPFKMLAVLTLFVALVIWLLGIETDVDSINLSALDSEFSGYAVLRAFNKAKDVVLGNALYRLLLQVVMLVVAVWIVFRKRRLNLVETFFAMVYLSCQMQLIAIVWLLLTRAYISHSIFPYTLPELLVFLVLVLDFRQLYGLRFWPALWRTVLVVAVFLLLLVVVIFVAAFAFIGGLAIERAFA